jgi:toxin ParE1/3/4
MANKRVEFHENAAAEYEAALDWYVERSHLAATRFSTELNQAIENISKNPRRWPIYLADTRRFFLRHFPFAVIYRELPLAIQVIAVAHLRRKPGYWKARK